MANVMIPDHLKEQIRDAADIVDVVSDYVKLKKSGSGFQGLCPFHNEKTPSFNVTPRLGIFKCFGCGVGGDVFNFVMQIEGVGFVEAMRVLAARYNIELPEEPSPEFDNRSQQMEGIYYALKMAGVFYFQQLTGEDDGRKALAYLEKRGLKPETIKKFGLGFSPDKMDAFYKHALDNGINEEYLAEAGLIKYSEQSQKPYDMFRGRLMFPIFSLSGRVIAFGARIMGDANGPKYINSPQTKVYNKSEVIYGIHLARNEIRKADQSILVEGYMDVISMHQHGVPNVVATSGTAITPAQMHLLKNYSDNILMVYDADNAGQIAMIRGLDTALSQGLNVRLMHLPEGEDPDSFVQQFGAEAFHGFCRENAVDFITFRVGRAKELDEWDDPIKKKNTLTGILKSIAHVSDQVMRETLIEQLRKLSGVGDRALFSELGKHLSEVKKEKQQEIRRDQNRRKREEAEGAQSTETGPGSVSYGKPGDRLIQPRRQVRPSYEKEIIRLMLQYGEEMVFYAGSIINDEHFEDEELKTFFQDLIRRYSEEKEITVEAYTEAPHPYPELVGEIMIERHTISELGNMKRISKIKKDADPYKSVRGALKAIRLNYLKRIKQDLQLELDEVDEKERVEVLRNLVEVSKQLTHTERTHSDELFPPKDEI